MRRALFRSSILTIPLLLAAAPAWPEELVLKDGHKITGTIVGYENDMFRVQTEFGFALIRKDKVKSVNLAVAGAKEKQSAQDRSDSTDKAAAGKPASVAENPSASAPASDGGRVVTVEGASPAPPTPKPVVTKPAAAEPSRPIDEPLPAIVREHVDGPNYVNDTFQFSLFRPLGWKIYEEAPKEAGFGIMAMGTEDERTLLIIDRQVWSGPPDLRNDHAEERLRQNYGEFKKVSESRIDLNGYPATRRTFTTIIDGVEWRGLTVHLARGNTMFGIIGMTSAETMDFQQAVLNKIIKSFKFTNPSAAASPAPVARP